jgi:MoxR-like ATPase
MLRLKENEISLPIKKILTIADVLKMQEDASKVQMPDDVVNYITELVGATRKEIHVIMGASPRADLAFMHAGKAKAFVEGRSSVSIDDIKSLAKPVLGHRITVKSTGGVGVRGVIDGIVASLK